MFEGYEWLFPLEGNLHDMCWAWKEPDTYSDVVIRSLNVYADDPDGDEGEPRRRLPPGRRVTDTDFPNLAGSGILVFGPRAWELLSPLAEDLLEPIPLIFEESDLRIVRPTCILEDAFDTELSKFKRFRSSGRIMAIDRYVLREPLGGFPLIFRLDPNISGKVFVNQDFCEAVDRLGLVGAEFRPVEVAE